MKPLRFCRSFNLDHWLIRGQVVAVLLSDSMCSWSLRLSEDPVRQNVLPADFWVLAPNIPQSPSILYRVSFLWLSRLDATPRLVQRPSTHLHAWVFKGIGFINWVENSFVPWLSTEASVHVFDKGLMLGYRFVIIIMHRTHPFLLWLTLMLNLRNRVSLA